MANLQTIVEQIATANASTKKAAEAQVRQVFEVVQAAILADGEVSIPGFGIFRVVEGAERTSKHPKTGETLVTPATNRLKFKVSSSLKEAVKGE